MALVRDQLRRFPRRGLGQVLGGAGVVALALAVAGCELLMPPEMVISSWAPGEGRLVLPAEIWLEFSLEPDHAEAERGTSLSEDGLGVELAFRWEGRVLHCQPLQALAAGKRYVLAVAGTVESSTGINLKEAFRAEFSTSQDEERPRVAAFGVPDRAELHDRFAALAFRFSEPVDRETWYEAVTLSPGLDCDWEWNPDATAVTGHPRQGMVWQTDYRVAVSTALKDRSGNALAQTWESRFRMGSPGAEPRLDAVTNLLPPVAPSTQWTGGALTLRPLAPTGPGMASDDGFEANWGILLEFSEAVKRENLEGLISFEPAWAYRIAETGAMVSSVRLVPQERLVWGGLYELTVRAGLEASEGRKSSAAQRYRLRVDGPTSRAPSLESLRLCLDPSAGAASDEWFVVPADHSQDYSTLVLAPAEFPVHASTTTRLDLHFRLAQGASLDGSALMRSFSASATNQALAFSLMGVQTGSFGDPQPASIPGTVPVRLWVTLIPDTPSGLVSFRLSRELVDSLGNPAADASWTVLK